MNFMNICIYIYVFLNNLILNLIISRVNITFVKASGERIKAKGKIGDTILDIVVNNEIDLDGYGMF